jgi:uncharacterized protein
MADEKPGHEPSMEEILASIRRIIAEDGDHDESGAAVPTGANGAAGPGAAAADNDVLVLTDVVEEDEPMANSSDATIMQPDEPALKLEEAEEVPPLLVREAPAGETPAERLISTTSAAASVAALSQLVNRPKERLAGELPLGNLDRTLEDMVRELLRPLLKTWLDENLPQLVERLVHEEIERLVRDAQGR